MRSARSRHTTIAIIIGNTIILTYKFAQINLYTVLILPRELFLIVIYVNAQYYKFSNRFFIVESPTAITTNNK